MNADTMARGERFNSFSQGQRELRHSADPLKPIRIKPSPPRGQNPLLRSLKEKAQSIDLLEANTHSDTYLLTTLKLKSTWFGYRYGAILLAHSSNFSNPTFCGFLYVICLPNASLLTICSYVVLMIVWTFLLLRPASRFPVETRVSSQCANTRIKPRQTDLDGRTWSSRSRALERNAVFSVVSLRENGQRNWRWHRYWHWDSWLYSTGKRNVAYASVRIIIIIM